MKKRPEENKLSQFLHALKGEKMLQQFNSKNDLINYLETLEERINKLEAENGHLRALVTNQDSDNKNAVAMYISNYIPRTNLLNQSFLKRSFAVWGHFFVANLLIALISALVYFCLIAGLLGAVVNF
jgi:hypothetical protein